MSIRQILPLAALVVSLLMLSPIKSSAEAPAPGGMAGSGTSPPDAALISGETPTLPRDVDQHPSLIPQASNSGTYLPLIFTKRPTLEWPQVQHDPQRTGYYPAAIGTNFRVAWTHAFQPERVFPQVQAIVSGGSVFVGTESGNMYALDAKTGQERWVFKAGGPILNSAAVGSEKVFFGAMNGAVYAVHAGTGRLAWKAESTLRLGFSTAPLLADGKVLLGGRDGVFYAFHPQTGSVLWQYDTRSPILQTAAWDDGRVFFGAMNMQVFAINSSDGSLAWKSQTIPGVAFKDYWPVVHAGQVFIRPMAPGEISKPYADAFPYVMIFGNTDSHWSWLLENGPAIAAGGFADLADAMSVQDTALEMYQANPASFRKSLYILSAATGQESFVVPHWDYQTMNGAPTPPCVDRDGKLITPMPIFRSGWGRLDLTRRRVTDLLYDHTDWNGLPFDPGHQPGAIGENPAGLGARDENMNVTCAANAVISMHIRETGADYSGVFDLNTRKWTIINFGYRNKQMSNNTQGGGGNPVSIAGGMLYHISSHELIARSPW